MGEISSMEQLMKKLAETKWDELQEQGYITAGHNGPYRDEETPVRNTAHWLITFSYCYRVTGNQKYYQAVVQCADYLITQRPMGSVYYCRKKRTKDFSNGLIGQAWTIEALIEAYRLTGIKKYLDDAEEVFLLHPFNEQKGIWKIVNVDGSIRGYDMAYNHQLWFGAIGAILNKECRNKTIEKQLTVFYKCLDQNTAIHSSGLIKHELLFRDTLIEKVKYGIKLIRNAVKKNIYQKSYRYKENGYQSFNAYAFALMKYEGISPDFFQTEKFKKLIRYTLSNRLIQELENSNHGEDINGSQLAKTELPINRYGYAYNAPGFELPFIYETFKELAEPDFDVEVVMGKQIEYTYNQESGSFNNNNEDIHTLSSRLYEVTRYYAVQYNKFSAVSAG